MKANQNVALKRTVHSQTILTGIQHSTKLKKNTSNKSEIVSDMLSQWDFCYKLNLNKKASHI